MYWNQNYQKLSYYLHVLDLSRVMKYKNDNIMWPFPIKLLRFPSSLHKICKLCVIVHIVYLFIMCLHLSALYLTFWTLRFIRIHQEKPHHWQGRYHLAVRVISIFQPRFSGNYHDKVSDVRSNIYNSPVNTFVLVWPCQFRIIISGFQNCQNTLWAPAMA